MLTPCTTGRENIIYATEALNKTILTDISDHSNRLATWLPIDIVIHNTMGTLWMGGYRQGTKYVPQWIKMYYAIAQILDWQGWPWMVVVLKNRSWGSDHSRLFMDNDQTVCLSIYILWPTTFTNFRLLVASATANWRLAVYLPMTFAKAYWKSVRTYVDGHCWRLPTFTIPPAFMHSCA